MKIGRILGVGCKMKTGWLLVYVMPSLGNAWQNVL
jgi:hypothetical protein